MGRDVGLKDTNLENRMKSSSLTRGLRTLTALVLVGAVAACSSDSGTDPDDDDGLVIGGLLVQNDGFDLASAFGSAVMGNLTVADGQTGAEWDVIFLDDEGVEFEIFADETMQADLGDDSFVTYEQIGNFSFRLIGDDVGETNIVFRYVQAGTTIYTSPPIPVIVFGPSE